MSSVAANVKPLNAIVVCGPSGVGKGTLLGRLMREFNNRFAYSVSHTTRAPRAGEQDGREYNFTTRDAIVKMRDNNEFLELCDVHGNFYGTSVAAVHSIEDQGKLCILEIDVKGAEKLKSRDDDAVRASYLFITAPEDELRKRIKGRGADSDDMIDLRLKTAAFEFAFLKEHPEFFSGVILNDEVERAYGELVDTLNVELKRHNMELLSTTPKKTN